LERELITQSQEPIRDHLYTYIPIVEANCGRFDFWFHPARAFMVHAGDINMPDEVEKEETIEETKSNYF